jgi:predicted phage terminase large subunit-like protein
VWQHCEDSGTLLKSEWFQERWPHIEMRSISTKGYANTFGATRFTTSPDSEGVGKHGDRIILDDLLDAGDAESTTRAILDKTNGWYDLVTMGRKETGAAEVLIMQRLHEDDIAAHALEVGDWTVLCLPERFEEDHPFAWRDKNVHPAVAKRLEGTGLEWGDPRDDGDLLWPEHRNEHQSNEYAKRLGPHKAAGQLQQRPAAREGELLKVAWWRFYDNEIRAKEQWHRLPKFRQIVISVDTPLKDKESSDNVAIQVYGVDRSDRYMLDLRLAKMNKARARREIREMWQWARKTWRCPIYVLIENAGYGVELIDELKREITGVTKISPGAEGNKQLRAESAADALESGNYFLPGFGPPWQPAYEESKSPADVVAFVHNAALFPNARHDDDVDAWSQAGLWLSKRTAMPGRTVSPFNVRRNIRT